MIDDLPDYEGWDCPTCKQIHPPETDYECGCCGRMASHHLSISTMCRIIDSWKTRAIRAELELEKVQREREQWRMSSVCRELAEQRDRLAEALREIKSELGVPQPEYPAPVANAFKIAEQSLAAVKGGNDE